MKEFTDFETKKTPEFRHPTIRGKIIQLKEGQHKVNDKASSDVKSFVNIFGEKDTKLSGTLLFY